MYLELVYDNILQSGRVCKERKQVYPRAPVPHRGAASAFTFT